VSLDFGDERSAAKIAEKLGVPVLLYATKEPPPSRRRSGARLGLLLRQPLDGRRPAPPAYPLPFRGVFFPEDPGLREQAEAFAGAVAVVKGLRNARLGQVGVRPQTFETVAYDEVAMARKFGQNVIYTNVVDLLALANSCADDDPAVLEILADVRRSVPHITVADDYLLKAAKLEAALAAFYGEARLSALTMQCWHTIQREYGISLCALFGRLTGGTCSRPVRPMCSGRCRC